MKNNLMNTISLFLFFAGIITQKYQYKAKSDGLQMAIYLADATNIGSYNFQHTTMTEKI